MAAANSIPWRKQQITNAVDEDYWSKMASTSFIGPREVVRFFTTMS
jgi:hypothetical protein